MEEALIAKYNVPGPRYTSYPTVPTWDCEGFNVQNWKKAINEGFWTSGKEISLYIHLPFCETLCTYCGCHTRITKNHSVEEVYINALLKEWQLYLALLPEKPQLKELHLGGGTPTFFSAKNLKKLIFGVTKDCVLPEETDFSFEGHPNNTTREHLQSLYKLGFRRVSFGIQDFDREVQKLINRIQPYENVKRVTEEAGNIGYTSINYDLVYGLPGQTEKLVTRTVNQTKRLKPSRIAFYGYAHIPQVKPAQKALEAHLPTARERTSFYRIAKSGFVDAGYYDIGMDHFALPDDPMYDASRLGKLHRNFMGYTTQTTSLLIGLGVSSISDTWTAFSQNIKQIEPYYKKVNNGELPLLKGHVLTKEDLIVRKHILNLMCRYITTWSEGELDLFGINLNFNLLEEMEKDGFINIENDHLFVTEKGRPFIRNVCMAFDVRMNKSEKSFNGFSKTI